MKAEFISVNGENIPVVRSVRKNISIKLDAMGNVSVWAPPGAPVNLISDFVKQDWSWIEKHRAKQQEINEKSAETGEPYTDEELDELFNKLQNWLTVPLCEWSEKIGVNFQIPVSLSPMTSRWGSCSKDGKLSFNILMMEAPERVRESIVVHELCHIGIMNHSDEFYKRLYSFFPDYDECRKWLNTEGELYIRRLKMRHRR